MSASLQLTSYDYDDLKSSLITSFKSSNNQNLADFDYEGSAINSLVSLLARNSHYIGYMANMLANESFLDTAQMRHNVVSHAQKLSYKPRSATASMCEVSLLITPASTNDLDPYITLEKGSVFLGTVDGISYTFVVPSTHVIYLDLLTNTYQASNITLYQGALIENTYIYSGSPLEIPNSRVDTSSLSIVVNDSNAVLTNRTFVEANELKQFSTTAQVYFLSQNSNGKYVVEFGKNILGIEPNLGAEVTIEYIVCEDEHANGLTDLIAGTPIGDFADIEVTVTTPAHNGGEEEDIEEIRYIAPKAYQAQNRAVTEEDYIPLLKNKYSFVKSAISWGGENNNPPMYGNTYLSILTNSGKTLVNSIKLEVENYLDDYNVGSITPIIVDPTYYGIDLDVSFKYNFTKTNKTYNDLSTLVVNTVTNYNTTDLNNFDRYYNNSKLERNLLSIPGIESVDITKKIFATTSIVSGTNTKYIVEFSNPLKEGSLSISNIVTDITATNQYITDKAGIVYLSTTIGTVTTSKEVGTIDYSSGTVDFTINDISSNKVFYVYVDCTAANFYMARNQIAYINKTTTSLMG